MMASLPPPPPPPSFHTSLLTATDCRGHVHLILGSSPLAAARANQSLSAGATPVLIAPRTSTPLHHGVQRHVDSGALRWLRRDFDDADLRTLGRDATDGFVDAVFVTGTGAEEAARISGLCRRLRVPVNVADSPALCSFSLLSTHSDGPLQVGVTTNGRGCKLAGRIRREVAASLPPGLGAACARLGDARRRVQEEDRAAAAVAAATATEKAERAARGDLDDSVDQTAAFNRLVAAGSDYKAAKNRRMRWLAQVCEYWPLKRLAAVTDADVDALLESYPGGISTTAAAADQPPSPSPSPRLGRIILAGSGPGHPDLLTRATHKAIQAADLVLADKLVPAGVLELVPRRTPVRIARKFPGNAERAQEELLGQALEGVLAGRTVLRLKQGDPFVYGRGGEEVDFFRRRGLGARVVVLPGVTSALSAPLFAGVPPTQRGVADQVLVCTGTGRQGRAPEPPEFVPSRTVVFLMALHRIVGLVRELTTHVEIESEGEVSGRKEEAAGIDGPASRRLWPLDTPCAVIERASCPDQRVIRTTLRFVAEAIEQEGSRPPGLLVVGGACEALYTPEKGRSWTVEDGFEGLGLDDAFVPGIAELA
ncbi:tetrapyrrole methylase [Phialemonium atrogriseum]|uniref:Tetrapyrrole methylase n=1 Tax=Phialemonium atrogriseum TaxID=1093897 RepID=A0AAJ0FCY1_9PEZI|nr:tetrapyrrole methylase [Phialemonium atrogriseum]KAK1764051.1 tetrapyrrole methylase [Phialemonium atrogriseum]